MLNPSLPVIADEPISPPTYERLRKASRGWAQAQLARVIVRANAAG